MSDDPYVYPGTRVLQNKLDHRDGELLQRTERRLTAARMTAGLPPVALTRQGFCALHRHLFEDVYAWAGELRSVDISRGSDLFCFAHHIGIQLDDRTAKLRSDPRLDSDTLPAFAAAASEHINELNAIHPFREGNGRTMRLLLVHLAERAGFEFRIARIDHEQWMHGSIEGFRHQNDAPLADVIARAMDSPERERTRTRKRRR